MLYYVPDLDRKAPNLAFFRDLQLHGPADQTEHTWNAVVNFTPSVHVYSSMLPTECFIPLLISI